MEGLFVVYGGADHGHDSPSAGNGLCALSNLGTSHVVQTKDDWRFLCKAYIESSSWVLSKPLTMRLKHLPLLSWRDGFPGPVLLARITFPFWVCRKMRGSLVAYKLSAIVPA